MVTVTGVVGRHAAYPVEMATRSGPGHAAMPAQPQSHGHVTCPAVQVRKPFLGPSFGGHTSKLLFLDYQVAYAAKTSIF